MRYNKLTIYMTQWSDRSQAFNLFKNIVVDLRVDFKIYNTESPELLERPQTFQAMPLDTNLLHKKVQP